MHQSSETVVGRIDLRPLLPPVRDQGPRSTCVAFAVTAGHEVAVGPSFRPTALLEDLAEEVLHWGCKQIDHDLLPGTTFMSAAVALQRWGQPIEAAWPYDMHRDDTVPAYAPPAAALDPAVCYKAELRQVEATVEEFRRHLRNGCPIVLGVSLSRGFFSPASGHIPMPTPRDMLGDGHAMLVVGYDDTAGQGGVLVLRNSWGAGWGDGGYGYLPYPYIQVYGGEAYAVHVSA